MSEASWDEVVARKGNTLSKVQALEQRIEASKKRLEDLKQQRKALARRHKVLTSKEARKLDARRKILVGAMLLAEVDGDASAEAQLQARLDAYLTRDDDRATFGFLPRQQPKPGQPSNGEPAFSFEQLKAAVAGK